MSRPEPPARTGTQDERLRPLVTVVPYALLAALVAVTLVVKRGAGTSLLVDLGLCAATALWMLWMVSLHPAWWERAAVMGVFFAGLVVLVGVLIVRDPWFGLFTPAGYFYAFGVLPWPWRLAGVAAVALEAGTAQADAVPKDSAGGLTAFAAVLAVNVIGMCGLAWWEWDIEQRNEEREAALEQVREANRRLRATLAENAGLHRQLLVQAREAGVLDERQRMAREIHDTLAQGLIGIVTQLQAAEQAGGDRDRWRQHFAAATGMARESLAEARRSVDALRPRPLETAGLGEALAGIADRWSALHGVTVRVSTTGTARPMRPEAELALLRAAQEALANVARHARAGAVALTLGYLDHEVTMDVRDDGRGFEAAPARVPARATAGAGPAGGGGGFGLEAMRERIEALSGTLQVRSEPGSGTTVSARVPHEAAEVGA
ncbi:sensor histidine kinase [Streptomyces sp. NBC_01477]|uniref:sensor histidine kinase n=1 Tax=Streptomyces sp. NBC_01477 TaxID=2976015 RepID=UPI002E30B11F|nr:histidine kinase [Streptomyces sp. NBC_01477]